jgi:hypothetical protein
VLKSDASYLVPGGIRSTAVSLMLLFVVVGVIQVVVGIIRIDLGFVSLDLVLLRPDQVFSCPSCEISLISFSVCLGAGVVSVAFALAFEIFFMSTKFLMSIYEYLMSGFRVLDPLFSREMYAALTWFVLHPGFLWRLSLMFSLGKVFWGFTHSCLWFLSLVLLVCSGFDVCSDRGPYGGCH